MNNPIFREIQFASQDYRLACELRQSVLRVPIGLLLTAADVANDSNQRHFGLFRENGQIIACISAVSQSHAFVKFRQMAVAESSRGSGHGRSLITSAEGQLRQDGFSVATLHARKSAIGFYEKLGYQCEGEEFAEIGIPHIQMTKAI